MKLNSLIISFYFPPFNRVGGRRWAKHLKYFKRLNQSFFVLAGHYEGNSSWNNDIKKYEDVITRVPIKITYPYFKQKLPINLFQKLYWKLSLHYWSLLEKKSKGNLWDDSDGSKKLFLNSAIKLINEKKINHVLLSVGPFHYSAVLLELRKIFPALKITLDYRDYWEDELHSLSEKQLQYEKSLQNKVLKSADLVLTVNEEMTNNFTNTYKIQNVYTLPHCYDPEDIPLVKEKTENNGDVLQFLYGGALYNKMDNYLNLFCKFIHAIEQQSLKTNTLIYTAQFGYEKLLNECGLTYSMGKYLSLPLYFEQIHQSDFILIFRPDWSPNAFSSKFYELLAFRKPILYFGPNGDVSKFIAENKLGFHFNEENFQLQFKLFSENLKTKRIPDKNYNIEQHSFEYQTKKLSDFFTKHLVV